MALALPRYTYRLLFLVLLAANLLIWRAVLAPPVLTVSVLPAGKGTAILVTSPVGRTLLIDAGSDASVLRALGTALPEWQRTLGAIVLTSATANATGGMPAVLGRYRTDTLVRAGAEGSKSQETALAAAVSAASTHVLTLERGARLTLGGGAYADILWPPRTPAPLSAQDGALAILISYGATSFLIQKDLPPRIMNALTALDAGLPPPNTIISSSTPPGTYVSDGREAKTPSR